MPIVVDHNRCKGCVLCVDACPRALIRQGKELNDQGYLFVEFLDADNACNACTLCAVMCPDMCIEVFREKRGTDAAGETRREAGP